MENLQSFFQFYLPHTDVTKLVAAFNKHRQLKKKEFLLQINQNCDFLAFIKKGSFRVFFYDQDAIEITIWFSFQGMLIGDLLAYFKGERTKFYIQAMEDSEIDIAHKNALESLFRTHPEFMAFGKTYAEYVAVQVMERMLSLQTKTAEARYLELLAKPNYLQKIPLKYLASYIGITDSSLSRIRKQIS